MQAIQLEIKSIDLFSSNCIQDSLPNWPQFSQDPNEPFWDWQQYVLPEKVSEELKSEPSPQIVLELTGLIKKRDAIKAIENKTKIDFLLRCLFPILPIINTK